ncbi:MAG TPA: BTAD domain-containing putative transcriptional regulator [Acidimicrobiales bacterium]|nr:BTAD domain-containing putative transcriptional regulator [Acidimicrobiales bacterium]
MELGILGPVEVTERGRPVPLPGSRERQLLALLAVSVGHVVSADRLVEELWGADLPRDPANALQAAISRLRRALGQRGAELVVTRPPGYALEVDPDSVDAHRFERLVVEARRRLAEQPAVAAQQLTEALALWRGTPLAELAETETGRAEVARLEELRLAAEEDRVDALLATGRHVEAVGELEALVRAQPLRERRWAQLMLALYRSGRQAEALRTYQEARRALVEDLGLEPSPELRRLEAAILAQDPSLGPPAEEREAATARHNLPAPATTFVGRWRERREVAKLLDEYRLVTLTGPGGVGKTRLALELVAARVDDHRGGVWLVELGTTAEGSLVVPAVAAALGVREPAGMAGGGQSLADRLVDRLAATDPLLVLDSCEHVIEACAALAARVLTAAPGTRLLATSREPLNVAGEAQYPVAPLAFPEGPTSPEELAGYDAVRLFVERAGAVHPSFSLDAETAPAVAQICLRLEGLPLALELAAARVRALPIGEVAARLDDRFALLTAGRRDAPPRQQTLRATLDWSHGLLTEGEATLFRRLSVFAGSFGLAAAEAVGAGGNLREEDVFELLSRLVDRSLLAFEPGADARYRMLETVREYGRERLAEADEADEVRRRHAAYFLDVAEEAERLHWTPGGGRKAVRRLEQELDELRAAIDWTLAAGDTDTALRLGGALGWFWFATRQGEGIERLDAILAAAGDAPTVERARALQAASLLEVWPLTERTLPRAAESLELFERLGDPSAAALSKIVIGGGLAGTGHVDEGERLLDEAEATFRRLGNRYLEAVTWRVQAFVRLTRGDVHRAVELSRRSLERFRELDDAWGISSALYQLAMVARLQRDNEWATELLQEALALARERRLWDNVHQALNELGVLAAARGDHERAAAYHEEALAVAHRAGSRASLARTYNSMGVAAGSRGDLTRACELHRRAADIARQIGGTGELIWGLICAGTVEARRGDPDAAEACHRQALEVAMRIGDRAGIALALMGLAGVAAARDQAEQAAMLLGAAAGGREGGEPPSVGEPTDASATADEARARLGEPAFTQAFERGRALGLDAVAHRTLSAADGGSQALRS